LGAPAFFRPLSSVFGPLFSDSILALFFHAPKTENFPYSFYIKELTLISALQKLALFCKKIGRFVPVAELEDSRQLSSKPWPQACTLGVPWLIWQFLCCGFSFRIENSGFLNI
jgi:hypothetical protein